MPTKTADKEIGSNGFSVAREIGHKLDVMFIFQLLSRREPYTSSDPSHQKWKSENGDNVRFCSALERRLVKQALGQSLQVRTRGLFLIPPQCHS